MWLCIVAYAQIDWHDFVVVETVDFQPNETGNFPPPTTPQEVGARVVQQERFERGEPRVCSNTVMHLLVDMLYRLRIFLLLALCV